MSLLLFAIIATFYLWTYNEQEKAARTAHVQATPVVNRLPKVTEGGSSVKTTPEHELELVGQVDYAAELAELDRQLAELALELEEAPAGWDYVTPSRYTIRELKHIASVHHVKGYGDMSKSQLFQAIALPK